MALSIFQTVFASGTRATRYGDFTVITLSGCAFVTTPMELHQAESWGRSRPTTGNANRDRMSLLDRFQTVLARSGSGIATRGNRKQLSVMVESMKANGLQMDEWSVPTNLNESMEMKRKPKPEAAADVAPVADLPAPSPSTG